MRHPFRNRRAEAAEADASALRARQNDIWASHREDRASRAAAEQARTQAMIDGIATDFYAASAIHDSRHNSHQVGVMHGLIQAMSRVTGRDEISTGFQMEHGVPQGPDGQNWLAVIDVINGLDVPVLLHDDVREPVAERLDTLRREALIAKRHPLAQINA